MKQFLIFKISLLISLASFSQNTDPVSYRKTFGGYVFEQSGKTLKPKKILDLFQTNEAAYDAMKKAKSNYDPAIALSVIGGALIGWPLGTAIGGGDPEWTLAGIGVGLLVLSIPLNKAFNQGVLDN
ncbi:MAG: hypothetical protein AAF843_16070 [Bacteroidota bacterium]